MPSTIYDRFRDQLQAEWEKFRAGQEGRLSQLRTALVDVLHELRYGASADAVSDGAIHARVNALIEEFWSEPLKPRYVAPNPSNHDMCRAQHPEIWYASGQSCPLCEARQQVEDLKNEIIEANEQRG